MCEPELKSDTRDEVIVARVPNSFLLSLLTILVGCVVFLFLLFAVPEKLGKKPLSPWELFGTRVVFAATITWVCYCLISSKTFRLILTPDEIVCKGLFLIRRLPINEIEKLVWYAPRKSPFSEIVIYPNGKKKYRLNAFLLNDYRCVVRYLRKTIPLEKQIGWKEYYLRNRTNMVRLPVTKPFSYFGRQLINPQQKKKVLYSTLFLLGFLGLAFSVVMLGPCLADTPRLFSVVIILSYFVFVVFVLRPGQKSQNEETHVEPCPTSIKVFVVLFFLCILFLGLAAIWNWLPNKLFNAIVFSTNLFAISGFLILLFGYLRKEANKNKEKNKLVREAEIAEYTKYAELLLPPELEE